MRIQPELSQMLLFDTYDPGITDNFGIRSKKEGTLPSRRENPPASIFPTRIEMDFKPQFPDFLVILPHFENS